MGDIKLRKRTYSQYQSDWEQPIDFNEVRSERRENLKSQIEKDDVDALLIYDPWMIRYATGRNWLPLDAKKMGYALATETDIVLFENPGIETEHRLEYCPWIGDEVGLEPSITWEYSGPAAKPTIKRWADALEAKLEELGVTDGVIGVDRLDFIDAIHELEERGWTLVDGWDTMYAAKQVKSEQELRLIDQTVAIGDYGFARAYNFIEPGVREREIAAEIAHEVLRQGGEYVENIVVASGVHTNPYLRDATEKKVRHGENVIIDINASGPGGYYTDYVRDFIVGGAPSEEQKRVYADSYNQVYDALEKLEPGVTSADIAEGFPENQDDEVGTMSLVQFGHGVGMGFYEPPVITRGFSMDYPQEIKANTQISVETYVTGEEEAARVEEQVLVTEDGVEILSLHPHQSELLEYVDNDRIYHQENKHYWESR